MSARALACTLAALALVAAPAALARTPLKPADMKTIRRDAVHRAKTYRAAYGARSFSVSCQKTTPYSARCDIRLVAAKSGTRRHNCAIIAVYVVVSGAIEGNIGRDTCD